MAKKKQLVEVVPEYKPSVYFDYGQIPKPIDKANVGDKVKFVVEGRVVSKSERKDVYTGSSKKQSASIEIDKVKPEKKKVTTKKSTNTKKSK